MAIDKTKITCPQCGNVYRVDPRIYKTKELVHCKCGRSWNADAEFEEICHTELKPYYTCHWTQGWGIVILILLPNIVALWCWIKYGVREKKQRKKLMRLQLMMKKKTDSPLLFENIKILKENIAEAEQRMEIGCMAFWINICIGIFFRIFI